MHPIQSVQELGFVASEARKPLGGLRKVSAQVGVGKRFLSEFERGKPTAEVGKVLEVLHGLGLGLAVYPTMAKSSVPSADIGFSKLLGTDFPYDWSNRKMDESTFIQKVLEAHRFDDVLKTVGYFGLERVSEELPSLGDEDKISKVIEILARISRGMLLAKSGLHEPAA